MSNKKEWRLIIYPCACRYPNKFKEYEFATYAEALAAHDTCADMLIFIQDEIEMMPDSMNLFVICKLVDGEWIDIEELDMEAECSQ